MKKEKQDIEKNAKTTDTDSSSDDPGSRVASTATGGDTGSSGDDPGDERDS